MNKQDRFKLFVENSELKHNFKFDYSKVDYLNSKTKVEIGCPIHGYFWQRPNDHLSGRGCEKCGIDFRNKNNTKNFSDYLLNFTEVHNDYYKYHPDTYLNSYTKMKITCPIHGDFYQKPAEHKFGYGCNSCAIDDRAITKKYTSSEFINLSNDVHTFKYDYSNVEYINSQTKVAIVCPYHGLFHQKPNDHLQGHGCEECRPTISISKPEIEVQEFVKSLGIEIITNNRKILKGKELDIYIPNLNKAIEFNGLYWHYSDKYFKPGKHAMKSNLCRAQGIKLLHIREDLWLNKKEKIKETLIKFLKYNGITKR